MGSRAIGQSGRLVPDRHFRDALRLAEVAVVRASAVGIRQDLVSFADLLKSGCISRSSNIRVHAPGKLVVGGADSRGRFVAGNAEDDVKTLRRHRVFSRLNYTRDSRSATIASYFGSVSSSSPFTARPLPDTGEHPPVGNAVDLGYVTVDPGDRRIVISGRIREEFENGRDYYQLQDRLFGSPE
jgi:hypothetical protein